jgi:hypothetical protein
MTNCVECGDRIGFLNSYHHPVMGRKYLVCSGCYKQVSQSVEQWKEFVLANSFYEQPPDNNIQNVKSFIHSKVGHIRGVFQSIRTDGL